MKRNIKKLIVDFNDCGRVWYKKINKIVKKLKFDIYVIELKCFKDLNKYEGEIK